MKTIIILFALCSISLSYAKSTVNYFGNVKYIITEFTLTDINIGIGRKISNENVEGNSCKLQFVTNAPLVGLDGKTVGGTCVEGKEDYNMIKPFITKKALELELKLQKECDDNNGSDCYQNFNHAGVKAPKFRNGILTLQKDGDHNLCSSYDNNCIPKSCEGLHLAFQNGPILVLAGKNEHNQSSGNRTTRSGIGFKGNKVIHIYTTNPSSFWELGAIFQKHFATDAIYLDGAGAYAGTYNNGTLKQKWGQTKTDAYKLQFFNCSPSNPIRTNSSDTSVINY